MIDCRYLDCLMFGLDVDFLGLEMSEVKEKLSYTTLVLLGLAYHVYQNEKHLLGDVSFRDWIDNLADKFESSEYFPKD